MSKVPTAHQLRVYEVTQRIRMQWTALIVVLSLMVVGFGCFLYAMFFTDYYIATGITGGLEGLFALNFRQVYSHLFPSPQPQKSLPS